MNHIHLNELEQTIFRLSSYESRGAQAPHPGGGGGGTLIHKVYGYVPL